MKPASWLVGVGCCVLFAFSGCGGDSGDNRTVGAGGGASEAADMVSLCEDAVTETCQALSTCCDAGAQFDAFECRRTQLSVCFSFLGLEDVGTGDRVYDRDAARACVKALTTCPESYTPTYDDYYSPWSFIVAADPAQREACALVQSGVRPPGSACYGSGDCAVVDGGGPAECFYGRTYEYSEGVCAQRLPSGDSRCGFDPETLVHSVCPAETFCDVEERPYDPYVPLRGAAAFAYSGSCVPVRRQGQSCYDMTTGQALTCAEGLVCSYDGTVGEERCLRPGRAGEPCMDSSFGCDKGLYCDYNSNRCVVDPYSGAVNGGGPFCYVEPSSVCGDARCDRAIENEYSCPADCSYCGDYTCAAGEEGWCPQDCSYCGDRYCGPGEDGWCPEDCAYCGDRYCAPGEEGWCPEDCANCGDRYCAPGEEGWCPDCSYCGDLYCAPGEQGWCEDCGPVIRPCSTDFDCMPGMVCDPARRVCVQCVRDGQCGADARCQDNRCVAPIACSNSLECPAGDICDVAARRCVECLDAADCAVDQVCAADRTCRKTCTSDSHCSALGLLCDLQASYCVRCVSSIDCPGGYACLAGECIGGGTGGTGGAGAFGGAAGVGGGTGGTGTGASSN